MCPRQRHGTDEFKHLHEPGGSRNIPWPSHDCSSVWSMEIDRGTMEWGSLETVIGHDVGVPCNYGLS